MTQASAPGKIVLWGEYAVLAGAPASVLALNTYANVTAALSPDNRWHFSSAGFNANPASCEPRELPRQPAAGFISAILETGPWIIGCDLHGDVFTVVRANG